MSEKGVVIEALSGVELAVFSGRLNAICEEMGFVLQRSSISPNIKDRLDFSCAIFDAQGGILAQAAHIPVHLGSMAYAMRSLVSKFDWFPGDMVVVNDPFQGGTHLPDVTMIAPFFVSDQLTGFVVNRAHHANIGSTTPGSMPLSRSLDEEGVCISPQKLIEKGSLNHAAHKLLQSIEPDCEEDIPEDFFAQISANNAGLKRIDQWLVGHNKARDYFHRGSNALNAYGSQLMEALLKNLPSASAVFEDYLDDDGFSKNPVKIRCRLSVAESKAVLDFSGTAAQVEGNLNCPESVAAASIYYVFACMLPDYTPMCDGVFRCIEIRLPKGSILNASEGAAVAAGNVETSMRLVDVIQGAFSRLGVDMPAASQGSMNNIAMGSSRGIADSAWNYYETLGGGMGASSMGQGISAVQCHMTNTLNTPVESLELHYPLRIEAYSIRTGSGGRGDFFGGEGLVRQYRFLQPSTVTLLTERRSFQPWGVNAEPGLHGENWLNEQALPAKVSLEVEQNDLITVKTPGGGGWSASPELIKSKL